MPVTSPTYQLTDDPYAQIEDLLSPNGRRGGQGKDHRTLMDGILWVLSDSSRWRNLPERFGPWPSVYDRFRSWTRRGLWDKIRRRLQARKMRAGDMDGEWFGIDGSVVRAHPSAAGASKKNSRPGSRRTMPSAAARGLRDQAAPDLRRRRDAEGGGRRAGAAARDAASASAAGGSHGRAGAASEGGRGQGVLGQLAAGRAQGAGLDADHRPQEERDGPPQAVR